MHTSRVIPPEISEQPIVRGIDHPLSERLAAGPARPSLEVALGLCFVVD
ncbi:hypothetical protein [uncultured Bradyrhizobium sp.]|nr:hypothetical protein [uncultured Bradyrhizobium sp.]